jgi:hypothetical protein
MHRRDPELTEKSVNIADEKIGVFEVSQQANVHEDRNACQPPSSFSVRLMQILDKVEIGNYRSQDDENKIRSTPGIKENACNQNP